MRLFEYTIVSIATPKDLYDPYKRLKQTRTMKSIWRRFLKGDVCLMSIFLLLKFKKGKKEERGYKCCDISDDRNELALRMFFQHQT